VGKWDGGGPVSARGRFYVACPANATTSLDDTGQAGAGATGDEIDWLWLYPATTTPGALSLKDGAVTVWAWPAGITLNDTRPIFVPLNLRSQNGAWSVVAGANMAALGAGAFS
jgi:hypothetical protein